MYLLFKWGGFSIECFTEDFVASHTDGIRMYHRTRKGQRGVSIERKLLCHLTPIVHTEVIQVLLFFDSLRRYLGRKIDLTEENDGWAANPITCWLHEVTIALQERPPGGFCWTSHFLRKGAATPA
jgi:hypothetical protein